MQVVDVRADGRGARECSASPDERAGYLLCSRNNETATLKPNHWRMQKHTKFQSSEA